MGPMVWRILGTGSAFVAAIAARKVMTAGWRVITGKEPPTNPESPTTTLWEAVGWAVASGAAVGTARLLATRQAARYYEKSAGHLPKGMEKVS